MAAYSAKTQPFLDSIATAIFESSEIRNWLLKGTPVDDDYLESTVLIEEQQEVRGQTKQPFWANYWCGKDSRCTCRIPESKALESDAIFFFRNRLNRILAVHIEFKHPLEKFSYGQPEAYPLRAACFAKTHSERSTMNAHDDWTTVLFCGDEALGDERLKYFDKVITHRNADKQIPNYPARA